MHAFQHRRHSRVRRGSHDPAESLDRRSPLGDRGPLATVVNVHFTACTPNFLILEYHPDDEAPRKDLLKQPLMVKDGYLPLPEAPGWGVELNEEAFRHYPPQPWHRQFEYRADGSVAFI